MFDDFRHTPTVLCGLSEKYLVIDIKKNTANFCGILCERIYTPYLPVIQSSLLDSSFGNYLTSISSVSKIKVALGGITPPAPLGP